MDTDDFRRLFRVMAEQPKRALSILEAQGTAYVTPSIDWPDSDGFESGDWDGSDAMSNLPNPSDGEDAREQLRNSVLLYPEDPEAPKSEYKLPFRMTPDGPPWTDALQAIVAAINGARGGVSGATRDDLEAAFDEAVSGLVAAGVYEDASEAPEFSPANVSAGDQDVDDPAAGDSGGSDDVVPVAAMDVELEAEATATFARGDDVDLDGGGTVQAADADPRTLTGIIWGAGKHDLALNGQATGVFVPDGETAVQVNGEDVVFADSIEPTFEQLKRDIQADDNPTPTLGFDHPDGDSVAAESGIVDLGSMTDVALSADRRNIVLTDSELTSESAIEANRRGDLDQYDWSVVGKVAKARNEDDDVVVTDDGRIVLAAARIERADIVRDGAVDAASIGDVPELAASLRRDGAVGTDFVTAAFRAEAEKHSDTTMDGLNPDDFETVGAALEAAADEIEEKESRIDDLEGQVETIEAKAEAFDDVADAEDVDVEDFDDPAEAAQAVVDARTQPLRQEIAATESELPGYDTGTDDGPTIEERADDLAGSSVSELKSQRGDLAVEILRAGKKKDEFGAAIAAGEGAGEVSDLTGGDAGGSGDGQGDELAAKVLSPVEAREADQSGKSPAEYVEAEFDVDPAEHESESSLSAAIRGGN